MAAVAPASTPEIFKRVTASYIYLNRPPESTNAAIFVISADDIVLTGREEAVAADGTVTTNRPTFQLNMHQRVTGTAQFYGAVEFHNLLAYSPGSGAVAIGVNPDGVLCRMP